MSEILLVSDETAFNRTLHVNLKENVDAAPQIQAEAHRAQAQFAHPCRRIGRIRHRNVGIRLERLTKDLGCRRLIVLAIVIGAKANDDTPILFVNRAWRNVAAFERLLNTLNAIGAIGIPVRLRELHRRCRPVNVRHGDQATDQENDQHQCIKPGGISIHRDLPVSGCVNGAFRHDSGHRRLLNFDFHVISNL